MSSARLRRRIAQREAQAARPGRKPSTKVTDVMKIVAACTEMVEKYPPEVRPKLLDRILEMVSDGACRLCGTHPPANVGVFDPTPELSARLLAPPGKPRLVVFGLCEACQALPDAMNRVDASIVSQAEAMADHIELN